MPWPHVYVSELSPAGLWCDDQATRGRSARPFPLRVRGAGERARARAARVRLQAVQGRADGAAVHALRPPLLQALPGQQVCGARTLAHSYLPRSVWASRSWQACTTCTWGPCVTWGLTDMLAEAVYSLEQPGKHVDGLALKCVQVLGRAWTRLRRSARPGGARCACARSSSPARPARPTLPSFWRTARSTGALPRRPALLVRALLAK